MLRSLKFCFYLKSLKNSYLIILSLFPILSVSANEYKFDQIESSQNYYQPKDKLEEHIIKGATYSTKFVPLMNDGSEGSEYTNIMANDGKRFLVDKGFGWLNNSTNSKIQKIPFFAQTSVNFSGGTESDTSFSITSLMKLSVLA